MIGPRSNIQFFDEGYSPFNYPFHDCFYDDANNAVVNELFGSEPSPRVETALRLIEFGNSKTIPGRAYFDDRLGAV